jgi:hypothetical protein
LDYDEHPASDPVIHGGQKPWISLSADRDTPCPKPDDRARPATLLASLAGRVAKSYPIAQLRRRGGRG